MFHVSLISAEFRTRTSTMDPIKAGRTTHHDQTWSKPKYPHQRLDLAPPTNQLTLLILLLPHRLTPVHKQDVHLCPVVRCPPRLSAWSPLHPLTSASFFMAALTHQHLGTIASSQLRSVFVQALALVSAGTGLSVPESWFLTFPPEFRW